MKSTQTDQQKLLKCIKKRILAKFDNSSLNDQHKLAKSILGENDTDVKRLLHELPFYRALAGPYQG